MHVNHNQHVTYLIFNLDSVFFICDDHINISVGISFPCFLPGHCLHEIFALREGKVGRVPDMVVWPSEFRSCVIWVFFSVFLLPCSIADPPPYWLRWFKGLISAEAGILICMSGGLIRSVRGRTVDTQYSTDWPRTVHPWIMILRLLFCCYGLALFYHANECWLMAETWLAPSQNGQQITKQLLASFHPHQQQILIWPTPQIHSFAMYLIDILTCNLHSSVVPPSQAVCF